MRPPPVALVTRRLHIHDAQVAEGRDAAAHRRERLVGARIRDRRRALAALAQRHTQHLARLSLVLSQRPALSPISPPRQDQPALAHVWAGGGEARVERAQQCRSWGEEGELGDCPEQCHRASSASARTWWRKRDEAICSASRAPRAAPSASRDEDSRQDGDSRPQPPLTRPRPQ